MTDNIQKLYEIAGVYLCNMPDIDCNKECDKCEDYNPFTAEKQLELIKWLANKFSFFAIEYSSQEWSSSNGLISGYYKKTLEESIADYINSLWQDLTEEEKQQIKDILQ